MPIATDNELAWSRWLAKMLGGVAEFSLPERTRVDILTTTLAIEVDWVKKWPEAIGQAIYYGLRTDRQPAILLLLRGKPTEEKYLERARIATREIKLPVFTWQTVQ